MPLWKFNCLRQPMTDMICCSRDFGLRYKKHFKYHKILIAAASASCRNFSKLWDPKLLKTKYGILRKPFPKFRFIENNNIAKLKIKFHCVYSTILQIVASLCHHFFIFFKYWIIITIFIFRTRFVSSEEKNIVNFLEMQRSKWVENCYEVIFFLFFLFHCCDFLQWHTSQFWRDKFYIHIL